MTTSTSTQRSLKEILADIHKDGEIRSKLEGHIFRVWEDGEATMTKCGSLLNQRNEHMMEPGFGASLPVHEMPAALGKHGYCFCADSKIADIAREEIRKEIARRASKT